MFQIPVVLRKLKKKDKKGIAHRIGGEIFSKLIKNLPFQLTFAQERVLEEIKNDMSKQYPMQRLLQGEVGSGKTIVALLCAAIALDGGYQVAFMVPTEILAKQHFQKAIDIDDKPYRITTEINSIIERIAAENALPLIDVYSRIEKESSNNIIGYDLFRDHVHLNDKGNRIAMEELFQGISRYLDSKANLTK